jgi:hypothetical protein
LAEDEPARAAEDHHRPCWSDRLFAATGLAPIWIGIGLTLAVLVPAFLGAWLAGRLEPLEQLGPAALFTERDPRSSILFVVLFAYTVTARRYVLLGGRRTFELLVPLLATQPGLDLGVLREEVVERPTDARVRTRRAALSLLIAPVVGLAVDRDPSLYLLADYWNYERAWQWGAAALLLWNFGLMVDATLECGRRFDALARRLERIDLLHLEALAPFANLGLQIALAWLLMAAIFALNLVDTGYLSSVIGLSVLSIGVAAASVLPPMLGARARVRTAKRRELDRIARSLRGQEDALVGSVLEARAATVGVDDLLAWRDHVVSRPEWPFDAPMLLRLALYVAIPLGSWVGGAFVERLLESTLD